MFSLARVPWMGMAFDGFIAGLLYRGRLHRFATYTGARITGLRASSTGASVCIEDWRRVLEIKAEGQSGIALKTPLSGDMKGSLLESLTGEINIQYHRICSGRRQVVFEGTGLYAGLEIAGRTQEIPETGEFQRGKSR
jgi:hypothetical protein